MIKMTIRKRSLILLTMGLSLADFSLNKIHSTPLKEDADIKADKLTHIFDRAQSYRDLKNYPEAIACYKSHKGGEPEEMWYSTYMLADCYEKMGKWGKALQYHLKAYQTNPKRAEPLYKIAHHYRLKGQFDLAYLFAKQGSQIDYPINQSLFIENEVYDYLLDEELSVAAYYTPFKKEGFDAANRLTLKKSVPYAIKENSRSNMLFYTQNLKNARFYPIQMTPPFIQANKSYIPMNASIQKVNAGYAVICRTVNYTQKGGKNYHSIDPFDEIIRTRNFFLHCDTNFNTFSQKEIVEHLPFKHYPTLVAGLEDCRLIKLKENYWFTCATYETSANRIEQSLCKLASQETNNVIEIEKLIPLKNTPLRQYEKNWLPFVVKDELYAVYSSNPFIIYKINSETGACTTALQYDPSHDFSTFRGSASPIAFDNGYLMLIHEVIFNENQERFYTHRFVYLDKKFKVQKLSKPFTFLHQGIEYCCGMTMDHTNKNCALTISIEDREAKFCTISVDSIHSLLEPLP
jgi:hypothetical protein